MLLVPTAENALLPPNTDVLVDPKTLLELLPTLRPNSPPVSAEVVVVDDDDAAAGAPKRFLLTPLVAEPNMLVPPVFPGTELNTLLLPVLALPNKVEVALPATEAPLPFPNNPGCELCCPVPYRDDVLCCCTPNTLVLDGSVPAAVPGEVGVMLNAEPPVPPKRGLVADEAPNTPPVEVPPRDPKAGFAPNADVVCGLAPNIEGGAALVTVVPLLPNKPPPKAVPPPPPTADVWPNPPVDVEALLPSVEVVSVVLAGLL